MKLISHRGNLNGPNSCQENNPDSIQKALQSGFDCEIDVWRVDGNFVLGHDNPEYPIGLNFFDNPSLWVHCKNYEALVELINTELRSNVFFHNQDDYTLTSKGIIWAYPGKLVGKNCVIVADWKPSLIHHDIYGICSDYVDLYKRSI
jgi:glycerophosphoryl diester phosphodiesterase